MARGATERRRRRRLRLPTHVRPAGAVGVIGRSRDLSPRDAPVGSRWSPSAARRGMPPPISSPRRSGPRATTGARPHRTIPSIREPEGSARPSTHSIMRGSGTRARLGPRRSPDGSSATTSEAPSSLTSRSPSASTASSLPTGGWRTASGRGRIIRRAEAARAAGADLVVLSLHWGTEFRHVPDPEQQRLARRLTGSGAVDLIVGHHAHVVQPIRKVHERWVAYGVGNSLTGMTAADSIEDVQDGMVLIVTFELGTEGWTVGRVRFAPTWVQPGPFLVHLVGPAIDRGSLPSPILKELRRSWRRTVRAVDASSLGVAAFRGTPRVAPEGRGGVRPDAKGRPCWAPPLARRSRWFRRRRRFPRPLPRLPPRGPRRRRRHRRPCRRALRRRPPRRRPRR